MKRPVTFFLFVLLGLLSCQNDLAEVDALMDRMDIKVELVRNVEILYSDSAQIRVRVTADTMLNNLDISEPSQEFIDGVFVEFFDPTGLITSTMTANYAIRFERKGEVVARDSVVWSSIDGQKLETEELIWNQTKEQISTQKFARITTLREIIYGHGFTAKQDFSNARIQAVEGIITIDQ